jgi:hypothetical protein
MGQESISTLEIRKGKNCPYALHEGMWGGG